MHVALFYYSLLILLACGITAATCLSSFFITRRKADLYLVACYLFYFLDAAVVYQDDFVTHAGAYDNATFHYIGHPVICAITGAGVFGCLWLYVCERMEKRSKALRCAPIVLTLVLPLVFYVTIADYGVREFAYFSTREAFMVFCLAYVAFFYETSSDAERLRLSPHKKSFAVIALLTVLTVVENAAFMLFFDSRFLDTELSWFFAERNISENLLLMFIAVLAVRRAGKMLSLRSEQTPTRESENVQQAIDDVLPAFVRRYGISPRESEVLRLVVLGKDNQNIASELGLALTTVKVHVHNVLKKCGQSNRQELTKAFWSR